MKPITLLAIGCFVLASCSTTPQNTDTTVVTDTLSSKKDSIPPPKSDTTSSNTKSFTPTEYRKGLMAAKEFYPFDRWRDSYNDGMTQYTKANCNKAQQVFDDLIASLIEAGPNASEAQKKQLFKTAILKTNVLNEQIEGLIETGEREDLCELTDKITIACGLDPKKYGSGEGLASEWREW